MSLPVGLIPGHSYKAQEIANHVADDDLENVSEWIGAPLESLTFTYAIEPMSVFQKQAEDMRGTYGQFPDDEARTDDILWNLKDESAYPVFVEQGDKLKFIMEGRHRIVAFLIRGLQQVPVFYVNQP